MSCFQKGGPRWPWSTGTQPWVKLRWGSYPLWERDLSHLGPRHSPEGTDWDPHWGGCPRTLAKYPEATIKNGQGGTGWVGAGPEFIQMNSSPTSAGQSSLLWSKIGSSRLEVLSPTDESFIYLNITGGRHYYHMASAPDKWHEGWPGNQTHKTTKVPQHPLGLCHLQICPWR